MTDAGEKGENCTALCMSKYGQERNAVPYAVVSQSCARTKVSPHAVTNAVSFFVSVQMDSRLKSDRICADVKAFSYPRFQLTIVFYSLAEYRVDLVKD